MLSNKTKTDPRVARTRKLIIDAFLALLVEKSFEDITIQDIAKRATVNRATFYAHFQDKYALVESTINETFGTFIEARLATPNTSIRQHIRLLFLAITDKMIVLQTYHRRSYRSFGQAIESQIKAKVNQHIQEWLAEDLAFCNVSQQRRDIAAQAVSWALYGVAMQWQQQAGQLEPEEIIEQALPMISASIEALLD
jgi:AcrR family transcriptional regulator